MSRRALVVIIVSLLAISATPVAVANTDGQNVVGSQHDTESELSNAQNLENLTVSGSGSNARVELSNKSSTDSFEDGDLAEWNGDLSEFNITNSPTYDGAKAVDHLPSGSSDWESIYHSNSSGSNLASAFVRSNLSSSDPAAGVVLNRQPNSEEWYQFSLDTSDGEWEIRKMTSNGATTLKAVTTNSPSSDTWYRLELERDGDELVATAFDTSGTQLAQFSVTDTSYSGGYAGLGGFATRGATYDKFTFTKGLPESARYVSAIHEVTNGKQATINITELSNVSVTATVQTDTGTVLNQTTLSKTGNHTLSLASASSSKLETVVDINVTESNPSFAMSDESILFTNSAPSVANASATPNNGTTITDTPVNLSIDISDKQFGSAQGEEVSVTFYNASDDSAIGTDTLTNNGTASVEWGSVSNGENEWYIIAEDSYGGVTQSQTFNFSAPETLYIYNESSPNDLVDSATVDIQFYFEGESGEIITKSTSDGTINMTGLPPDQPFIVVAEADGYHPRRIYVESLLEEQRIYLLPESAEFVDLTFELEDFSGDYPSDSTVLKIEREINGNWSTVQGDFFGATSQLTAQLAYNQRHRLTLINTETGETKRIGTLTPTASGTQTISVTGSGEIQLEGMNPTISVNPSTRSLAAVNGSSVGVDVSAGNKQISEWTVTVTYSNESVNTTLHNQTITSGPGTVTPTFDLRNRAGGQVLVSVEIVTESGETITDTVRFGVREHFDHDYSLLSTLSRFTTEQIPAHNVASATTFLAVLGTVLITGMVAANARVSSEVLGGVAVGSIAAFSIIGWAGLNLLFAASVTWIAAFALRRGI